jgi:TRAP-type C4-dicarboxylate transport system permease small subunit
MSVAEAIVRRLARACEVTAGLALLLAATALGAAVAINFANVVGRYVFHRPLEWAEEIMLYLMIASVFLGVGAVTWRRRHIRMDMAVNGLSPPMRLAFSAAVHALVLGLCLQMLWAGAPVISMMVSFGQRSEAAQVPMWLVHGVIQVGFAMIGLFVAVRLAEEMLGLGEVGRSMHEDAVDEVL